jgi:hypothetical protein
MQLATITPIAAPRGMRPKQGPIPVSLLMNDPKAAFDPAILGPNGDIYVKTYPKYQVVRQSTMTLP